MTSRTRAALVALVLSAGCGGEVLGIAGTGAVGDVDGGGGGITHPLPDGSTVVISPPGRDGGGGVGLDDGGEGFTDASTGTEDGGEDFDGGGFEDSGFEDAGPEDGGEFDDGGGFEDGGEGSFDGGGSEDGGPVTTFVPCGATACDNTTQECCVSLNGGASTCVDRGTCQGAALSCTGSDNCGDGEVCCATFGATGATATCQDSCSGGGGGGGGGGFGGGIQLCSSDSDCTNGEVCEMSQLGVSICRHQHNGGGGGGMGSGSGAGP
jgi:hypothetical protein